MALKYQISKHRKAQVFLLMGQNVQQSLKEVDLMLFLTTSSQIIVSGDLWQKIESRDSKVSGVGVAEGPEIQLTV